MSPKDYYFVTHARQDHDRVQPLLDGLQAEGIKLWLDSMLSPGEAWSPAIEDGLESAKGLLVFLSQESLKSPLIQKQLDAMKSGHTDNVVPILLEPNLTLPTQLDKLSPVSLTSTDPQISISEIVDAINKLPPASTSTVLTPPQTTALAEAIAESTRLGTKYRTRFPDRTPDSIFIVHGHDLELRDEVDTYLKSLAIETVILSGLEVGGNQSLFQKFLTFSEEVEFAVVLLTADDYGASRRQYDAPKVADRALQFRARQNVILELGFFYGYLGWENVFVLYKPPSEVFPNFELPSDMAGILFDEVGSNDKWKENLWIRLEQAGFEKPSEPPTLPK